MQNRALIVLQESINALLYTCTGGPPALLGVMV